MWCGSSLTAKLTDRHDLTYENQKLQGKSPSAKGGSVQRLVRCLSHPHRVLNKYPSRARYLARQEQQVTVRRVSCPHCCRLRTIRKINRSGASRQCSAKLRD